MEFIKKCIEYCKDHLMLTVILAASALAVVLLLIIIGVVSAKRKKAAAIAAWRAKEEEKNKALALAKQKADAEAAERAKARAEAAAKAKAEEEAAAKVKAEEEKRLAEEAAQAALTAQTEIPQKKAEKKSVEKPVEKKAETAKPKNSSSAKLKKSVAKTPVKTENKVLLDELKDGLDGIDFYEESETDKAARYSGKWVICRIIASDDDRENEEMYFFELHASNGEKLLASEEYTSYSGALRGIETHKTNILNGNFKITLSKKGDYIFKLLNGKNMLLCMGENYPTRARCESAVESAKRFAQTAVIDENVQDQVVKVPPEDDKEIETLPEGYNGKWIIDAKPDADGNKVFYFELFANNGERLLTSEEYTTYVGAVNGIQTHKNNISKGNFRISLTKRGDYIYKLLNGNNQLLCLGEHYKTKRRCQNAVESVKRFAMNSPVLTDPEHAK